MLGDVRLVDGPRNGISENKWKNWGMAIILILIMLLIHCFLTKMIQKVKSII